MHLNGRGVIRSFVKFFKVEKRSEVTNLNLTHELKLLNYLFLKKFQNI